MKDLGLFALRLVFGGLIALHGYPKLFGGPGKKVSEDIEKYLGAGFNNFMENGGVDKHIGMTKQLGMPAPEVLGSLSAGTEFFGGLALIFGWKSRLASALLIANMAVAIQKVHAKNGLMGQYGFEMPLLYIAAFATVLLAGPGKIGLDKS